MVDSEEEVGVLDQDFTPFTQSSPSYSVERAEIIYPNKTNLVLGGRTFKNSGRLAFNSLPSRIKEASSLAIFKRLLKGHFI